MAKELKKLGGPEQLRVCYEAGPTGYGLMRELVERGIECIVVAPSLVPRQGNQRVKTDRRDAVLLARYHRAGALIKVEAPSETTEAIRDLSRAREDGIKAQRIARQNLGAYLLRQGRSYSGKTRWTKSHLAWVKLQHFELEAQQRVLEDYLQALDGTNERVRHLEEALEEAAQNWELYEVVLALQALRGVRLVAAVTLMAELGDLGRFESPRKLMAYLGLVPSEHSSGQRRRQGGITKTGNGHARRILVESGWAYRFRPRTSRAMRQRRVGLSPEVLAIADRAQRRLCRRYQGLMSRGKKAQVVITAIARELAGFVWAIAREPRLLATPVAQSG